MPDVLAYLDATSGPNGWVTIEERYADLVAHHGAGAVTVQCFASALDRFRSGAEIHARVAALVHES